MDPTDDTVEIPAGSAPSDVVLSEFICDRCGYHYKKVSDFAPYLCYRCMRFMAKKVWNIVKQLQPTTSRAAISEI